MTPDVSQSNFISIKVMTGESHLNIPKQTFIKASFVLFVKSHGICHGLAKNIVHRNKAKIKPSIFNENSI